MNILSLPDCVFEIILSYLSYDDIAKSRLVCRKFNEINKQALNHGFYKLLSYHSKHMKRIKAMLPRRESERRNHYLAKHSDVLTCIETRLSMLSMTYQKHMQNGTACFIPGKIIDECYRIIRSISNSNDQQIRNLRAHEILQELRDISSMAIEHFDEKIAVDLRKNRIEPLSSVPSVFDMFPRASLDPLFSMSRNTSCSSISTPSTSTPVKDFPIYTRTARKKSKMSTLVSLYKKQSKVIKTQSKQIYKMMKFLRDQKTSMNSLKRRLDESEKCFKRLTSLAIDP
ncbi:F-box only protein 28-like isoform X2 [Chironomus tepperi]|uniref:F-box only protein 28-like isoform X2 n=1 Tax=Chironomus tepperi TaxID=113505 RepID=UPI00391F2C4D